MTRDGPTCAVQDCDLFADKYVDGVTLEGLSLEVYICDGHAEEMDERAGTEVSVT